MKLRILLLFTMIFFCFAAVAQQGIYNRGLKYCAEVNDTSMLFMDVVVNNYLNNPVSAVGQNRTERVFYYSSSHRYGETLYMMSVYYQIAAVEYAEYFIFDALQSLVRYAYVSNDVEFVYNIEGKNVTMASQKNPDSFTDNYFILDTEIFFSHESILERCDIQFSYCTPVTGIPNYEVEVLEIRELYKSINADNTLRVEKLGDVTKYYRFDELVKIVIVTDRSHEFYFDNGSMFFAFVSEGNGYPEQRLYMLNSLPFKLLYGKQNLPKEKDEFWDYSDSILGVYQDYLYSE